jgi:hypothetical protein
MVVNLSSRISYGTYKYTLLAQIPGVVRDSIRNVVTRELNYRIT